MKKYMSPEEQKPPETVKELGIHFIYMTEDIKELKQLFKDGNFVKSNDLLPLQARVAKLEAIFDGIKTKIAAAAVIMLVIMVLALYGLDKFLKI